jgi:hypothetical protein
MGFVTRGWKGTLDAKREGAVERSEVTVGNVLREKWREEVSKVSRCHKRCDSVTTHL